MNKGNIRIQGFRIALAFLMVATVSISLSATLIADGEVSVGWIARYDGPAASSSDGAYALAVDGFGNVYVTGWGNDTSFDYVTIKYNAEGTQLWVARYDGEADGFDRAFDIITDDSGNVYVTGLSWGTGTSFDYVTVKYDTDGNELWASRYDGPAGGSDYAYAIAVDEFGNVYVTGVSQGIGTGDDYATVKYAPDGDQTWVARYNGPASGGDAAYAIALDSLGNTYVTGNSYGSSNGDDYATVKYDSDGIEAWVSRYDGPAINGSDDRGQDVGLDSSGNVYVTGWSRGDGTVLDYATIKYDEAGEQQWAARYNGPAGSYDWAVAMEVDDSGNVYVTGESRGSGTGYDYASVKYDSDGNQLWASRYDGPAHSDDYAYAVAADGSGNVYVTGESLDSSTGWDYTTICYNSDGDELWTARYDGTGSGVDEAYDIAVDAWGNVYVTGQSKGIETGYDFVTIKYVQAVPGDANGDGEVTVLDWIKVKWIMLGLDNRTPGADVDQDGDVDVFDWVKVKRIVLGLAT